MSASSKKKLRKEQEAAKLTEKQQAAQQEAKKNRLSTSLFVVVMAVILVIAVAVGVKQTISTSGIREKNTTALTIGQHKLSNAELNYYNLFVFENNNRIKSVALGEYWTGTTDFQNKEERQEYINKRIEEIKKLLESEKIKATIYGRSKTFYSIYRKTKINHEDLNHSWFPVPLH